MPRSCGIRCGVAFWAYKWFTKTKEVPQTFDNSDITNAYGDADNASTDDLRASHMMDANGIILGEWHSEVVRYGGDKHACLIAPNIQVDGKGRARNHFKSHPPN